MFFLLRHWFSVQKNYVDFIKIDALIKRQHQKLIKNLFKSHWANKKKRVSWLIYLLANRNFFDSWLSVCCRIQRNAIFCCFVVVLIVTRLLNEDARRLKNKFTLFIWYINCLFFSFSLSLFFFHLLIHTYYVDHLHWWRRCADL